MSQVKSLWGPSPNVTWPVKAREKYFWVISSIRVTAWSRSDSEVST